MRDPAAPDSVSARQAAQSASTFADITLIAGASQCGAVLAAFVARPLGLPVAFLKLEGGRLSFHRTYGPPPASASCWWMI